MVDVGLDSFIQEFNDMLNSNKYISFKQYNLFVQKYKDVFNSNDKIVKDIANNGYTKIESHNENVINNKLVQYKDYFDNMFKGVDNYVKLDDEQRRAILNEEDYSLIIAGAGAGKTTTMAAKVKYLIEKCNVNPEKIAVISYTNKATEELEDKIKYGFNLPVNIMTFHSLGIKIIRKIFSNPITPITEKEQKEVIIDFVKDVLFKDRNSLTKYINTFNKYNFNSGKMFSKGFVENYQYFDSFESYFINYKMRKQEQNKNNLEDIINYRMESYLKSPMPTTLKNEKMRSLGEAKIANFLFTHGIDYKYEEPYPEKVDEEDRAYRPDFTIMVNDVPLYIEYYGLSTMYVNGTLSKNDELKYNDIRQKKRAFHDLKRNNFIELDYKKQENGETINYLEDLEKQLINHGVQLKPISNEQIYDQILNNNVEAEFFRFVDLMLDIIQIVKSHPERENYKSVIKNYILSLDEELLVKKEFFEEAELFRIVYDYYQNKLLPARIDFADMIFYANKYMRNIADILDYEYIIIDEYQDISIDRYYFAKNLSMLSNAKVISVGDDWQTIFSFAGSRIDLFLRYNSLFPGAKNLFINNTYRSSQELIDKAGNFIMRNPLQIKKNLFSNKSLNNPIKFYTYNKYNQYEVLKYIITSIYKVNPKHHILILARKNKHIARMFESGLFTEGIGTRVILNDCPDCIIDAMSVHSAKGLGADQVIILNVSNIDFPCPDKEYFWLKDLFKPKQFNENYPYAEDRRIFYVALTRTKNDVYLLIPEDINDRSPFIKELI